MFSDILAGIQRQFAGVWASVSGLINAGAVDVGDALSRTALEAKRVAMEGITNIGAGLDQLSRWTNNQLAAAFDQIGTWAAETVDIDRTLVERARQYLLARLAQNPLGVMGENAQTVYHAGGAPSFPDPNVSAPWAVLDSTAAERARAWLDNGHHVRAAIAEVVADRAAWKAGKPTTLDPIPSDASALAGGVVPPAPRGGDPDARGLLKPQDLTSVIDTTS